MEMLTALRNALIFNRVDLRRRFDFHPKWIQGSASVFHILIDRSTGEKLGLKIIDRAKQKQFRQRFKGEKFPTEQQIAKKFDHPNIVKTIEVGRLKGGDDYLLMEYEDGPLLEHAIASKSPLLVQHRIELIPQIAAALKAVHDAGFIHRDICPRNLICDKQLKSVKLFDFGLTLPNQPPFRMPKNRTGTPLFMAPEIVRRRSTGLKVDMFAFGVTVYQILTLEHPWEVSQNSAKSALIFDSRPASDIREHNPEIKPALANAVHSCLESNPDKRCASMKNFLITAEMFSRKTVVEVAMR